MNTLSPKIFDALLALLLALFSWAQDWEPAPLPDHGAVQAPVEPPAPAAEPAPVPPPPAAPEPAPEPAPVPQEDYDYCGGEGQLECGLVGESPYIDAYEGQVTEPIPEDELWQIMHENCLNFVPTGDPALDDGFIESCWANGWLP